MSLEVRTEQQQTKRLLAMGQMAAALAHEIRNPLGSMELFCTLLKKDLADDPDKLGLAEQIHEGIRLLDRIITNCLQFSRDITPRRKLISDVKGLLEQTGEYVRTRAEELQVEFSIEVCGERDVSVDPHLFNQVLFNLALNAIDATVERRLGFADGGEDLYVAQVTVSSNTEGEAWQICVRDNGVGIESDVLSRIFDPFFSTKQEGTGLGLAITHSIVVAHNGNIAVSSEVNKGTTVTLELPFSEQ